MNNLLIDGTAGGIGVAAVTEECRLHLVARAHVARDLLKAHGRHPGSHSVPDGVKNIGDHAVRLSQAGDLAVILDECALVFFHVRIL